MAGSPNSAQCARKILNALQAADLPALENALRRSAELLPPADRLPAEESERCELLMAIAERIRGALESVRRGMNHSLEGLETWLDLLSHLARPAPQPVPLRLR